MHRTLVCTILVALLCIVTADTCGQFDLTKYGANKPDITAVAVPGNSVKITVKMLRQDLTNTVPIFHDINTVASTSNVCHNGQNSDVDNIQPSAGVNWVHTTEGCTDTYELTQSIASIISSTSNNNWAIALSPDGRTITYTIVLYTTYSVNNEEECHFVGYRTSVIFQTRLSVESTSDFITADNSAKFSFSGLRVTTSGLLQISGKIIPLIPGATLGEITLTKDVGNINIPTDVTTCSVQTGCPQIYSAAISALGGAGADISGVYTTAMNVYEDNAEGESVVTRPGVTLTYTLAYVIPTDPAIVDSDTITTSNKLYTDNTYSVIRTNAYSSVAAVNDKLFIENKISDVSPVIPTGYTLRMTEGYLCCVDYALGTFPVGGCKNAVVNQNGIMEAISLGSESAAATGVALTTADDLTNKHSYRLQVTLSAAYNQAIPHSSAMICQVQLFSKLQGAQARRIGSVTPNTNTVYVSTSPYVVQAQQKVAASSSIASVSIVIMVVVLIVNML